MCKRNDPDVVIAICVHDKEGGTVGEVSSSPIRTKWPALRGVAYGLDASLNFGFKIEAEPSRLVLVPYSRASAKKSKSLRGSDS